MAGAESFVCKIIQNVRRLLLWQLLCDVQNAGKHVEDVYLEDHEN